MFADIAEKTRKALDEYVTHTHPGERLREFVTGSERLNVWLEIFLLGPIAGAVGIRNYYLGLTDQRVILMALDWWHNKPTADVAEVLLGRISEMKYKSGLLTGKLNMVYGDDVKRTMTVHRRQFENARRFVDTFSMLPKPLLTDEEIERAILAETAHKQERKARIGQAIGVVLGLVVLIIFLNLVCANA
jgi:hypothetical protein